MRVSVCCCGARDCISRICVRALLAGVITARCPKVHGDSCSCQWRTGTHIDAARAHLVQRGQRAHAELSPSQSAPAPLSAASQMPGAAVLRSLLYGQLHHMMTELRSSSPVAMSGDAPADMSPTTPTLRSGAPQSPGAGLPHLLHAARRCSRVWKSLSSAHARVQPRFFLGMYTYT